MGYEFRKARSALLARFDEDSSVRLALAALYRSEGFPDQAGRWGVGIDGWATRRELIAYSRLLQSRGGDEEAALRRLSRIPDDAVLEADAIAVLEQAAAPPIRSGSLGIERVSFVARLSLAAWGVTAIGVVAVLIAVFRVTGAAFLGSRDLSEPARVGGLIAAMAFGSAAALAIAPAITARRWWAIPILVVLAAVLLGAFVVLVANHLMLPGER